MTLTKVQSPKRKGLTNEKRETLIAYSFIAPNFIGFCVFTLVPIVFALLLAFCEWNGITAPKFVGLDNFIRMVKDPVFHLSLKNTLIYTLATVPMLIVTSLLLALLLNQPIKGRDFFRSVSFFPYVASLVAVAAVWNMIFSPAMGPVNQLLAALGVENLPKWAAGNDTALLTVILFSVWKGMGYYMVIYLAGLQGINTELYEAAALDGANSFQRFWNVTLPQLAPTTFFVTIMATISSFKVYDNIYMITQGGPGRSTTVLVYQIYNEAFVGTPEYGYASALSLVLFILVLSVTILQFRRNRALQ